LNFVNDQWCHDQWSIFGLQNLEWLIEDVGMGCGVWGMGKRKNKVWGMRWISMIDDQLSIVGLQSSGWLIKSNGMGCEVCGMRGKMINYRWTIFGLQSSGWLIKNNLTMNDDRVELRSHLGVHSVWLFETIEVRERRAPPPNRDCVDMKKSPGRRDMQRSWERGAAREERPLES